MKKPNTVHGIDLTTPGGLEALFAFNRSRFGDATMSVAPGENPPADPPKPAPPTPSNEDEKLGEPGLKALKEERDARAEAERERDALRAKVKKAEDEKLSDIDKANKAAADAVTENAKLERKLLRLQAIADNSVPKKWQHLVSGDDAAALEKSAKDVAELAAAAEGKTPPTPKPDTVPDSGHGQGSGGAAGSTASGRDAYNARNKRTTKV